MYVKVRSMDGSKTAVLTISKLTSVSDFRRMVEEKLQVAPERQRLFYRGKQMEDGHNMFEYNININDVIQLMVKQVLAEINTNTQNKEASPTKSKSDADKGNAENVKENEIVKDEVIERESEFYQPGDLIDIKYTDGTWWEGKVAKITVNKDVKTPTEEDDGLAYHIVYDKCEEDDLIETKLQHMRPRANKVVQLKDLKPDEIIMVNYNMEDPEDRGYWYDFKVSQVTNTRSTKELIGTIYMGIESTAIDDCKIKFLNELLQVNKHIKLTDREGETKSLFVDGSPIKRVNAPNCLTCKDNPKRKCKDCGCHKCGLKDQPDKTLMCDECDNAYHIYCLDPPLTQLPEDDEWFCPLCKNDDTEIVKAGEKLKHSKKKAQMASAKTAENSRDWGKGFACAGRQKTCNIVPTNHFGPIPGVEVGTLWRFRLNASEAGVHRPHVAGIAGRGEEGAYSVVLAGGYEDDVDDGDKFTYTGSGGRDLSGNKRTAEQSSDQELTRMNKALALNVNAKFSEKGAEAEDWKGGKPVRVIRNAKGRKHSKYAPEEGNRYDGIYKIVKYWPEKGQSGFKVWRYLFRRDDPIPAPWTKEGKKRTEELGLTMIYPEGYLEAQAEKEKEKREKEKKDKENKEKENKEGNDENDENTKKKRQYKRKSQGGSQSELDSSSKKKKKIPTLILMK
ncbi:unnamed protein product, partial [Meganyctiphanes norvegica]